MCRAHWHGRACVRVYVCGHATCRCNARTSLCSTSATCCRRGLPASLQSRWQPAGGGPAGRDATVCVDTRTALSRRAHVRQMPQHVDRAVPCRSVACVKSWPAKHRAQAAWRRSLHWRTRWRRWHQARASCGRATARSVRGRGLCDISTTGNSPTTDARLAPSAAYTAPSAADRQTRASAFKE